MSQIIKTIIAQQRMLLQSWLAGPMQRLTAACVRCWPARTALERCLAQGLDTLPWCKHLFVLDNRAHQLTANVSPGGLLPAYFERDRSGRPDLSHALAGDAFSLSDAYISRNARRPSLTAVQRIVDGSGTLLGFSWRRL
nr:PDC sensor domain-containing protein [Gammaproteobacteria bacterium]